MGWWPRRYKAVFVNKLSDAMQEASETQTWLEFSLACGYLDQSTFDELFQEYENILGKRLRTKRLRTKRLKTKEVSRNNLVI